MKAPKGILLRQYYWARIGGREVKNLRQVPPEDLRRDHRGQWLIRALRFRREYLNRIR